MINKNVADGFEEKEEKIDDIEFTELNTEGDELTLKETRIKEKETLEKKFLDKIVRLEKERDEYLAGWQRVQADYKNREKEIEEYQKSFIHFANQNLIKDILPVLDGFDIAKNNLIEWQKVEPTWRTGVEYLFSQLLSTLGNHGLKTFGEIGEKYDSYLHEAVEIIKLNIEEKEKDDTIIFVLQKGYKIADKILRVARVRVGRLE